MSILGRPQEADTGNLAAPRSEARKRVHSQHAARNLIGCYECAWGKVAGCWRCGSRARAALSRATPADQVEA